ncbi:heterokaryon incompatibility protein-domain-containing protein [Aspergillus transmontanensis]|uniref:Heterokaryon incompatibility protein-domain-containing protein n=1 Tax=Aspergillus transmontanensis TaxID=1034304 RepID=A0A5N6WAP6_9EURO|nr:heterokaryon incompatibility protein-domain-containing protein [Aspergillus transmontanensis]
MPELFKYDPLPSPTSIRLVSLVPQDDADCPPMIDGVPILQLALCTVDLQNGPHYDALSYTWGSPFPPEDPRSEPYDGENNKCPVMVNGRIHYIGRNLWEFLRQQQRANADLMKEAAEILASGLDARERTPLMRAVKAGRVDLTEALLALGAETGAQDRKGKTALHHAIPVTKAAFDLVELLVYHGADIYAQTESGETPLDLVKDDVAALIESLSKHLGGKTLPRGLRLSAQSPMWIDSISINQTDIPERNSQVALMSRIYSEAMSVVVWLGVEDESIPVALEGLKEGFAPWADWTALRDHLDTDLNITEEMEDLSHNDIQLVLAIEKLMKRTWWSRTWVIQELALAKHALIVCGSLTSHSFPTAVILGFLCAVASSGPPERERLAAVFESAWFSGVHGIEALMLADISFRTSALTGQRGFIIKEILKQEQAVLSPSWGRRLSLQNLGRLSWWSQSSDPRDKVFALVGIASPDPQGQRIIVDYSMSIAEVFVQYGHLFMQGSPEPIQELHRGEIYVFEPLEGLSYVQENPNPHPAFQDYKAELPSWTPNFSAPLSTTRIWCQKFSAASDIYDSRVILPHSDPRVLCVRGHIVDKVVALEWIQDTGDVYEDGILPWLDLIHALHPIYPGGGSYIEALWQTLTANQEYSSGEDVRTAFQSYLRTMLSHGSMSPRLESVLTQLYDTDSSHSLPSFHELPQTQTGDYYRTGIFYSLLRPYYRSRRLFRTKGGYIGLGPGSIQPGDEVWLFATARTPFILRRPSEGSLRREIPGLLPSRWDSRKEKIASTADNECRTFIGETYVHGIMNGEAMRKDDFRPVSLV